MHPQQQQQQPVMQQNQMFNQVSAQQQQQKQKEEQIYAPVAHLQQKMIHQQQQQHNTSLQQHPQQQQNIPNSQQHQQATFQPGSPESTEYGFGVQFQQHQSQFYQMQHQPNPSQPNSHHLQYTHSHHPGQQILQSSSPHHQNRFSNQPHPQQMLQQPMHNMNLSDVSLPVSNSQHMLGNGVNSQSQMYNVGGNHDQIMGDIDAQLRQRPQPPPIPTSQLHQNHAGRGNDQLFMPSAMAEQTAQRVRKWIESKSVSNVKEHRPLLNAEIHQGYALRKTTGLINDRSAPKF